MLDYQESIKEFVVYDEHLAAMPPTQLYPLAVVQHIAVSLAEEVGEIMAHIKRLGRGDGTFDLEAFSKEVGDSLFYLVELCNRFGLDLEEVMEQNISKLESRQERGVIRGSGDDR